jgi:hypothetical protein
MIVAQHASPTTCAATDTVPNARGWRGPNGSRGQAELLPVPYFHVVFTLPPSVGEIALKSDIESWAKQQKDKPSRWEAIRRDRVCNDRVI